MPAIVSGLQVYTPATPEEAVAFLADHRGEGWRPLAGGTDVMMGLYRDRRGSQRWMNIARLRDVWGRIAWEGEELRIGALATMAELRSSPAARAAHPLIGEAARVVGAVQIQNRATVGGNIANGSPAGDTLPVWLALDAVIELTSQRGVRRVAFETFMTGYRQSVMAADELLTGVLIPRPLPGRHWYLFRKVAPRAAQGISKVVLAATGLLDESDEATNRVGQGATLTPGHLIATAAKQHPDDTDSPTKPTHPTQKVKPARSVTSAELVNPNGPVNAPGDVELVEPVDWRASDGRVNDHERLASGTWRHVRLAWGSMGPFTKRAYAAERRAEGGVCSSDTGRDASSLLNADLSPIDDARSTAAYRLTVARNLAREFLAGQLGRFWRP
jgi:CO/xanthine dehydrogenase FAD-binding subunit